MASELGKKLENEMKNAVDDIEKNYLRKMQADMHRCSIACCEDKVSSRSTFQQCLINCSSKIQEAQNYVQKELGDFQDRLNRCHRDCSDKIRDEMTGTPSELDIQKFKSKLDKCADICAENHIKLVATLLKRTKSVLSKEEFNTIVM